MTLGIEDPSVQIDQLFGIVEEKVQVLERLRVPETLSHVSWSRILSISHVTDARISVLHFGIVFETLKIIMETLKRE